MENKNDILHTYENNAMKIMPISEYYDVQRLIYLIGLFDVEIKKVQ